ncbi:MAG: TetR/AcrR family transcriptional regulator [Bacteroidetes bacterium]|nr:TetR/AcrR family transcriptional regulator [Bacteroidota bacterium]
MKNTKDKILDTAHHLFNEFGVAPVSIRQISKAAGISHGNLMYHFNTKQEIITALHERLLLEAIALNSNFRPENFSLAELNKATEAGFTISYKYRFFFVELLYVAQQDEALHKRLIEVEQLRAKMYKNVFVLAQEKGLMRQEMFSGEFDSLITQIRILSDSWISSSLLYDNLKDEQRIKKYAQLLMDLLKPYLN